MSKLSDYLMNNTPAANVPEGAAPGYEDDGSSDDSGFSASSIQNAASNILDALSHPSFLQGGTVIAPDYTPRQLDDDASDVPIQEANPTYQPYAASTALNNFIQDHTTVIAPNYTPRPLDDSVYSDIPGTPVASGQFGELEDESVRDERMKDSADYMAANWPRLYGGFVAADEGLANVVGGIQNAVGGGNGILHNVQRAEEGMQDYRDQWNNEYGDSYFLNPNKFATDVGSGIGSTVPIMALSALMPGAAVAGGTRALTAALSRAGLGRLAMSKAGQALIADTVRSPISSLADSLSEYGTVVNDMMQSGMSEDEARRRAIPMFFKNMALDTFTVPLELGVMKGGKGIATGLLGRGAEEGIGKSLAKGAARTGMLAGASGLTEGYQEGAQNALENDVQGKRDGGWYNPFTWTNEDWQAARGGFVGGALMGIPGNVAAGFHPEARQAPLSAESREQAQSIKDTLSHGKPKGMSNAAYNAYIELANSGNPDLIKQAASSLESFQKSQGNSSSENTDDAATEAYKDYETYDQKQEIENFLNNNTVEQIGGEDNYNWLVGALRSNSPEEVQKAYDNVVAAEKATAEMEAKNRAAQAVPAKTGNNTIDTIIAAAQQYGDDPKALISVGARESGGDDINAIGKSVEGNNWFQIEPATAEAYGVDKIYPDWETDPTENIYAAALILRKKTDEANGDVFQGMHNYNGGGDPDYDSKVQATYNSLGDLSGVASDSGNVSAPDQQYYDLSDQMNPQVDGMDPNTMAKMNLLARDFYQKYGHRLLVTSLKRNGDGSSYHDEGHAFDFSDDFLEQNPDARDWLVQQGEKYGLKGLDEFSHPVATTDGGNVHFTDHGGPVPGGTSGAVTGKITSDDGQFDRELDQAAQEAKSDMDRIQAQSDQAMNEIMNDDSAEKTAQEAQEDAENAQKQAEESQQSTQDAVIPDVAQTIRDTSSNIDEINTLDGMFTKDGNGNDKFIDTPENRDFIKANYKDEITKAVNDAMSKKKAPIATPVPKNKQQTPHARLGRILATYDRKDPKFKEYMNTFRNGTEQEQRKLADDLQTTQELERANSLKGNPLTSQQDRNTLQNVPQRAVEAPEQTEQVNTPTQVKESLETRKKRNAYLSKKQKLMERVPSGKTVKVHASTSDAGFDATYKIVPAGDITASHNTDYAVNDLYPAELQPRDRNRPQMRGQVEKMAKTMKPELLAESQFVNEGAPIVNNSGVVLNGNGRVMAIQKAYQGLTDSHKKSAKAYKDFLASIAPSLGIAPEKVQSMAHPVLVRQAADDADTKAIINSTEGGAKLGGAEQAKTDADRLKLSTLEQFVDNGTGEFMNPSNREFRRTAAKDIFSDAEGNSVFNAKGELSPIGALRIRNAIFAKAYKDDYLLTQLSEATDNNSKNIMNAMIAAAPEVAKVNEGIKEGNLYPDYDISDVITKTAKTIMSLRNEGKPLSFHLQETSLFSQGESEAERLVLEFIERNKFKSRTIADMYKAVCDRIFAVGSPKQSKLFDSKEAPRISLENIISNAIQEVEHGQSLFDTAEEKPAEKAVSEVPDNRQAEPAGSGRVHQQEAGRVQSQEKEGNEVDEKSKQSDHVNAEPQQTESKDKESSHAEEGPQSDVQEEVSKFHDLLNIKESTPRKVVDAYKRIADAVVADAKDNPSKAKAGEKIIVDNHDLAVHSNNFTDVFIKRRLQREITAVYDNANEELRAITESAGKEETKERAVSDDTRERLHELMADDNTKSAKVAAAYIRFTKALIEDVKAGKVDAKTADKQVTDEYKAIENSRFYEYLDKAPISGAGFKRANANAHKFLRGETKEKTSGVTPYKQAVDDIMDRLDHKKLTPTQAIDKLKTIMKDANAARWGEFKAMDAIESKEKLSFDDYKMALDLANDAMKKVNDMRLEASRNRKARKTAKELESATKETQNDADIRFGTVEDAEKAVMKAFGIKPHKKPADTPAVPHETSTKATPKKAVKKAVIKDNDKIEKTFHLLDDSDEALEAEKKAILKELSHLSANPAFNPTLMYHLLKFGAIHVQRGLNEFARWAKAMKDTLPQSEPFLQSVWASLQAMPNHAKLDEKQLTAAIRYVGSLYDHGMTDKVDLRKSFIATLGVKNAKYFDAVYNAVMEYPSIEELKGENDNVNSNVPELVARSGEGASENAVGESRIQGGTAMRGSRQDTAPAGKGPEEPRMGHDSVPGSSTATGRTAGNRRVQTQESKDSTGSTGSTELPGSVRAGLERVPDDDQRRPAELVRVAQNRPQHEDPVNKVQEEQKDKHLNEIKKALPMLLPQQAEDVYIAEDRFKEHSGMMFTNGTGTGKTYTGLGIVKRFVDANKKNILIIAPSDGILKQWEEAATKDFGITLTRLNSTKDAGKDVVTATYANVGANRALVNRDFDLVITDESHNLMGSESAKPTDALQLVRAVTGHEDGFQRYHHDKHPEISSKLDELHEEIKKLRKRDSQNGKAYNETHDPSLADESREISNQIEKLEEERSKWHKKLETFKDADEKAFAEKQPSKVLFLSATPFQYVADLDYANGYLFNYSDYGPMDEQGYNRANGRETFYMENFGYKMRYNRLERPGSDVDTDLMEREFNRKMVESGAMHGRMLSSAYDYDRGFIRVDAGIGKKIDEDFDWLRDQPKYSELSDFLRGRFTGQQKYYLLEAIKAKQAIPLIKEYLKEGKKVVIFHNFNKGGADNPFAISREGMDHLERLDSELANHILEQYHEFQAERPDLADLDLNDLESPIETLSKAFGDELVLYNGTLSKGEREKNKNSFNNDDSKTKIILVQSAAGQAGVSLHDTTGKHQRALINLGLPTRPSEAIQQEGRIYRVGNKSNAIFRYLNTGTYMEQMAFATKLAERAGTVENIALGEMARSLKQAYVEAFEESQEGDEWKKYLPGSKTEGTGGKANDYRQEKATDFDRAKAVYFGKQKKNSRTKSQEGHDYFATPEPVGYKMVQWLQPKPGQSLLEPSAGDGAIARWMPDNTYNTVVEPSRDLTPKLMRNVAGAKVVESTFENFDLHNKFDGIAMNPPFGHGGKTAVEHVAKAYQHLKDGGRLIAIIPDGSACQKHFDKWFYGDPEAKRKADRGIADGVLMADIHLPSVTFDRAGTNVNTRMVVIDKYTDEGTRQVAVAKSKGRVDISADDVNELFDRIEDMNMPELLDMSDEKKQASIRKVGQQLYRSKEDLKAEIKEAFPNAKEIKDEGDRMTFTMPNGSHIVVDMKNEIVLTDKELAQAKKDHHIDDNGSVVVEGYAEVHGKDAYMALAQGSREGTGFHEAYHLAEGAVLTDREKTAIKKAIPDVEKRADKYAEWVEARKRGRGTAWGKLFQKIKDFAAKMKKIFTGAETVNDVFRKIESGEVWERGANNSNQRGSYSVHAKRKLKEDMQAFAKKIDDFMNNKLPSNEYVRVMDTPLVLNLIGEKMLPVYISPRVLDKVLHWKHGLEISPELLKEIPRRIADPIFILKAIDNKGIEDISSKIIVVDLKDNNGATIMLPFVMNQKTRDRNKIAGNIIKSVYGKTIGKDNNHPNNTWYINRLMRGDCIYINKKRTDHWLTGINTSARTPNGPLVVDSFNLSNIIADETDLGKLKKDNPTYYSIREQDQKISNEAKKRFMNHIEVAQKQADENAIGVHRTLLQSPSRIAEKKKYFKPFFKMADDAMNLLTKLRADYQRHLDSALDLSKKDKASLQELLWSGDMEGKEYTREELREQGYNEQVIDSYWKIRNLFRKAYNQLNETRKQAKTKTGHFSGRKLDELRHNKFVEILRETDQDDGSTLVSYKEYGNWQAHYLVNEDELKSLENDDNIQILEKVPTKEGPMDGQKHWKVITREGVPDIHDRKGYVPHFFHEYMVRFVDSHGKATVVSSGRTIREATKNAIKWQAENEEMLKKRNEGDWKITISPKVFDFGEIGLDESQYATTVGDKDFYMMEKKIADKHSLTLHEAKEMLDGMVKKKGRHRFFGNFLRRTGADGYEQEVEWVLRHYFNSTSRYVAMESKFKPQAISLFERLFGRFDNEYHGLPNYIKEYINDINGNPSTLEKQLNDLLNAIPAIGKWVNAHVGDRAAVSLANSITNKISIAKLGFLNVSSAMLNILQIANAAAYTGNISTLWKALLKGAHRKYSLHDLKILRETNVLNDIGLDSGAGYGKFSAGKWANRGMILFKESEGIVRRGATLTAYETARKRGMSHEEAIRYAKDVNRKSNFDYGVHDAPGIFRRGSIFSQIFLQFKKYPIKQLEAMKDFLPFFGKGTTKKQKAIFWGTYFAMAGLFQIPFANILGLLIMGITGDDPEKEAKKSLIELAENYPSLKPLAKIGMYGIGTFANIDITSRVGIGDAVPDDLQSLFGPAASTLFNVAKSAYGGDNWTKQVRNVSPGLGNLLMAAQGNSVGKRGRVNQEYTTPYQRLLRGMGFQSTDESDSYLIQSILSSEKKKASSKKQQLIDEYIANPTGENARKLKNAGIKPSTVKAEQKKKKLDTKGRTESSMNKNDKKQYQYLLDW